MGTVSTTLPSDGQTIDASDVNTPINAILSEFNGNIDNDNIKTGANINGAKLLASSLPGSSFDTTLAGGWISGGLPAYSSATNNGNKSYDIVFASTVASLLSPGMRLRTTRTVTAPTQCADLEAGSSQYFNKTTPNKLTFTDDFTCMAWVKLESYAAGGIISRFSTTGWIFQVNASGQLVIQGSHTTGPAHDYATSYQSLPLGKWVHVAASLDISGTSGLIYVDGVLVPSAYTNGAQASLTQAGNLEVGSIAGANFFDGKIAQAAVFDAVLSAATIRSYMSQGLAGTETNLKSAYSFNGVITDLNTTTPNDLTAQGSALATATDSPFGQDSNGVTAGTTDYALVMKVSTATATVQVPEGCTIPTSGGVSAVAYSTATSPFGFTLDKGRWEVGMLNRLLNTQNTPTQNQWYNLTSTSGVAGGLTITIPVGSWQFTYHTAPSSSANLATIDSYTTISTANNTESDPISTTMTYISATGSTAGFDITATTKTYGISVSSATIYYLNTKTAAASMSTVSQRGDLNPIIMRAVPSGI